MALLLAIASWRKPQLWRGVIWTTTAVAGFSVVGLLLKLVGVGGQENWRMIGVALPSNLATMIVARHLAKPLESQSRIPSGVAT